jgi:hypothetical protein
MEEPRKGFFHKGVSMSKNIKKTYKIPFMPDGSVPHYADSHMTSYEWKEADYSFDGILIFQRCVRGRSAAYFLFKNKETNAMYSMFLTDMEEILSKRIIAMGMIGGRWKFVKRGSNYGIASC